MAEYSRDRTGRRRVVAKATIELLDEKEQALLKRVAEGTGQVPPAEVRELARLVGVLAEGQAQIAKFLKDGFDTSDPFRKRYKR